MSLESDVKQFLEHVLGPGEGFLALAFRYGKRFDSAFYQYPADLDRAVQIIRDRTETSDVFFCAHLLTAKVRQKENAAPVHTLWADGDGDHDFSLAPEPTVTIETSPGHHHAFYRLDRVIDPDAAERLNRALAGATGADPSGWDITQLLRIPGTLNHKYDPPVPVRLVQFDSDRRLEPEAFETLPEADARGHSTLR